jgi:hypothetical protein
MTHELPLIAMQDVLSDIQSFGNPGSTQKMEG